MNPKQRHSLSLVIALVAARDETTAAEIINNVVRQQREIYYLKLSKNGSFHPVQIFISAEEIAEQLTALFQVEAPQLSKVILAEQATSTWYALKEEEYQIVSYLKTQDSPYQPANTFFRLTSKQDGGCVFFISREINAHQLIEKIKIDLNLKKE